jgi:MoxR-like ATPase
VKQMSASGDPKAELTEFLAKVQKVRQEIGRVVVGNDAIVDGVLTCMLAGSHVLLEGVPGLGKTLLVKTIAQVMDLAFSRIQFTPDLMPADIIGTTLIDETQGGKAVFEFRKGPLFANIVLADEVNRATPKTQSALLEAMQERHVTVGRTTHALGEPYFVLATQNPLEMEGTYPLPEAQLDRFFYKLLLPFPGRENLHQILQRTTGEQTARAECVLDAAQVKLMQQLVRRVPVAHHVQDYAVRLLLSTHPDQPGAHERVSRFVRSGASPRGAQAMLLGAKIRALFDGRLAAGVEDVKACALPALRHRVLLSFEGEADGVRVDEILSTLIQSVPETLA